MPVAGETFVCQGIEIVDEFWNWKCLIGIGEFLSYSAVNDVVLQGIFSFRFNSEIADSIKIVSGKVHKREKEKLYLRTVLHIKSFEKHQGQENVCAKWLIYVEMRLITIVEKHKSITIVSELWERFDIIWNESGWT